MLVARSPNFIDVIDGDSQKRDSVSHALRAALAWRLSAPVPPSAPGLTQAPVAAEPVALPPIAA